MTRRSPPPPPIPPQRPRASVPLYHRNLWSAITEVPDGMLATRFFSQEEALAFSGAQCAAGWSCRLFPPGLPENCRATPR